MNTPAPPRRVLPRLFALHRREDVNGQSGTGLVAYGVRWPSGKVTTWWQQSKVDVHQISQWDSIAEVLRVHGHGARTVVVWLSADPDDQLVDTAALRVRWDAYRAAFDARADPTRPLARYEAAIKLVPELLPLVDAYEHLAAAYLEQRRDLATTRAEADALRTALDVTASLVPQQEEAGS